MGWCYESDTVGHDEWHEGYMLPEFPAGERGRAMDGSEIPAGHIAAENYDDGTCRVYPAGAVIGWRVVCTCYRRPNQHTPDRWVSDQLWTRVPSPVQHDPNTFRIYAADADVDDIAWTEDVEAAARALWRREHIDEVDAAGAISAATAVIRAGEAQRTAAVLGARRKGLSWAKIGTAANMTAQGAHDRWAKLAATEVAS